MKTIPHVPSRSRKLVTDEATLRSAIRSALGDIAKTPKAQRANVSPADALPLAIEHLDVAYRKRVKMPDQQEDAVGHAECVRDMQAHVKAAASYLETYRYGTPLADPQAEDEDPDPTILSPEGRQTRAAAAVLLHIGGDTAEARRLIKPPRPRK
jgi:hypothetical protein